MQEIQTTVDLITAAAGDPLIVWAAQGFAPGVRAWHDGDAVAVVSPGLFQRDRLVVAGPPEGVARLVTEIGTAYRPLGDEDLIRELPNHVPGLEFSASFGWMDTAEIPPVTTTAAWLDGAEGIAELLTEASPSSFAWPDNPAVRRWAAIRDEDGQLLSIAAEAWSAPEVGFIAGVTTRPVARGKGLSREVCGFVTAELVKRHGQAGLMVDRDNVAAIAVYHRLGYTYRRVAAAGF